MDYGLSNEIGNFSISFQNYVLFALSLLIPSKEFYIRNHYEEGGVSLYQIPAQDLG